MNENVEESLCCLVSKAQWNAEDQESAKHLLNRFSPKSFWELANFNEVSILAAKKLSVLGVEIPSEVTQQLEKIQVLNLERRARALSLFEHFGREGIDTYLLKGFLLGELVYGDSTYKRMNDIDIVIRKEQVVRAVEIAKRDGFSFAIESLLGSSPLDFRLHHSPPLLSHDKKVIIGLHWGIASPFASRKPRTDIFSGEKSLVVGGVETKYFSHEVNLLHLCIHLPFFKTGLRELGDVANLMNHVRGELNFDLLVDTAKKWRAEDAVYRVLILADAVIPCLNADQKASLEQLAQHLSSSRYVTDTKMRARDLKLLLRSRSTYIGKVEKNFALFKLATRFSDRWYHLKEQWRLVLRVPEVERRRLLLESGRFSGLRAAAALCFAMMQDLGVKLFVAITVKNVLSLLVPSQRSEADFKLAKKLLENME